MSLRTEDIEKKAEELLLPLLEKLHYEFVDLEYVKEAGNWYLRAYADKEGGITVDDCEVISRAFEVKLDEGDFIEDAYILEVSSPGLGRPLKKERDYVRAEGEEIEIRTYRSINREKEFTGILKAWDKDTVTIHRDEEDLVFERKDIALIRMAFDF
ncbi:MAG: ribosome maturation factor RimP [Eubacteriales bacterium]|nr:ribosome maturation factor RimP [Eubacteriales bacterium]